LTTSDTVLRQLATFRSIQDGYFPISIGSGLPLLLSAEGGLSDVVTTTVNFIRPIVESLITSDSLARPSYHLVRTVTDTTSVSDVIARGVVGHRRSIPETLTTSAVLTWQTGFHRADTEATRVIDSASVVIIHYRHLVVALTEYLTTVDVPTFVYHHTHRVVGVAETLTTVDVLGRHTGEHRSLTETLSSSDVLTRLYHSPHSISESLTTSDTDVSTLNHHSHNSISESLTTSDTLHRLWVANRLSTEHLTALDVLGRHITTHRTLAESLTTNPVPTWWHNSPRFIVEHLTTSDAITGIEMFLPIMGYIWYNPVPATVQFNLPDWGFILIEDPITGVSLNFAPIAEPILNFAREK
jgi:hypothetical protein